MAGFGIGEVAPFGEVDITGLVEGLTQQGLCSLASSGVDGVGADLPGVNDFLVGAGQRACRLCSRYALHRARRCRKPR